MAKVCIATLGMLIALSGVGGTACAGQAGMLDDGALKAYAAKPFDKGAMMGRTTELGRYRGVPVVAEFPCSDVCPQYTVRIIHFRLPPGASCAVAGGVEKEVLVPIAITVRSKTFCVPEPLAASGLYYAK